MQDMEISIQNNEFWRSKYKNRYYRNENDSILADNSSWHNVELSVHLAALHHNSQQKLYVNKR